MTQTSLYRHFDATGRLLYVGISSNPFRRLAQYISRSPWAFEIANVTLAWFPTRLKAEVAERRAVKAEKPAHNTVLFVLPRRKAPGRLSREEVAALVDHYNAHEGESSTIEGCAAKLNLSVPALRKMLWLPRGAVVTLSADDVFELLLRTCRGPMYASEPYMADCLAARLPVARRKAMAKAQQARRDAWDSQSKKRGRPSRLASRDAHLCARDPESVGAGRAAR